jgi:hypothetical protein
MSRQSLSEIANQYGKGSDFGHYDTQIAKQQGYSNQEILDYLDANPDRLGYSNKPGNEGNLYNELLSNNVDFSKGFKANRGGASGAEIAESNAQRDQQFTLDRIAAQGAANANIQRLINISNKYAADSTTTRGLYAADAAKDATIFSSESQERTSKYVADIGRLSKNEIAKIQGNFGLALQEIVNSGAKEAEAVRGEYGLANTNLTGQYQLENTRLQGATERDVASRNRDATIFGSLMSGFWS